MRIISQDKRKDIPYEDVKLFVSDKNVTGYAGSKEWFSIYFNDQKGSYKNSLNRNELGQYSSEEKALKVMEMIRDAYSMYINDIQYNNWIGRMKMPENNVNIHTHFQMPQDYEVQL